MPRVKTIRTVRQRVEREEEVRPEPKFGVGDYMEVYFGQQEGHNFWVQDLRYNHDTNGYEYLYGGLLGGWMIERQLVLVRKAAPVAPAPPPRATGTTRAAVRAAYEALVPEINALFVHEALCEDLLYRVRNWVALQEQNFLPVGWPGATIREEGNTIQIYPHGLAPVGVNHG